ncbi:hypothetical protein FACS1894171_2540 [Clostridia bacterium]|nr:hypothetical protein FACS1894171_2540 [Clostridia bacterium]
MPELKEKLKKAKSILEKYKYLLIVVAAGIILLLIPPALNQNPDETPAAVNASEAPSVGLEEAKIESALQEIRGVGRVKATLSLKSGGETIYANEVRSSSKFDGSALSASSEDLEYQPALVSRPSGGQEPLVIKYVYPEYKGALIVCDGADDPTVKLRVVDAVSSLLGLGSDKIIVLKMKPN